MPTTDMRATQARDIVSSLEQQLDLGSWPDPQMVWFSSSVSERHPGKRYHPSSWCGRLRTVKTTLEYQKAFSEVAAQLCHECFTVTDDNVEQHTQHRLRELLRAFESIAHVVDDGRQLGFPAIRVAQRSVGALEQHARMSPKVAGAAASCAEALSALVSLGTSRGDSFGSDQATFAARLLEGPRVRERTSQAPEVRAPSSARGGQLLSSVAYALREQWGVFTDALIEGQTPPQAGAAAAALISTDTPHRVEQLTALEVTATHVGQQFTIADLLAQWQEQASAVRALIIEDWVCAVNDNIARSAAVGLVRVRLTKEADTFWVYPPGSALAAATSGRYPAVLGATASVEVPATLAAVLLLEKTGTFEPNSNCSEDMLKVAHGFLKDRMDPLTALVTAKAVVEEPARSQALAA